MREDVGTTKRKPLTRTQRLRMFEEHKGLCVLCGNKITTRDWIDEHLRSLVLGGTNDLSNRGPAHSKCAAIKTHGPNGDIAKGAEAKRQKMAAVVAPTPKGPPMRGRKFSPVEKETKPKIPSKFAGLQRRSMFVDVTPLSTNAPKVKKAVRGKKAGGQNDGPK